MALSIMRQSAYPVPSQVTDLVATTVSGSMVSLTWTVPSFSSGSALTNDVRISTSPITSLNWNSALGVDWLSKAGVPGTAQTALIVGLNPNTRYYFAIKTKDAGGWSQLSTSSASAVTGGAYMSVTIAWPSPTSPSVVGFNVYYGTSSGVYPNVIHAGLVTSLTISNLTWGVPYYFSVSAYNANGVEGDLSSEVSKIGFGPINLMSIASVPPVFNRNGSVTLAWDPSAGTNMIAGYKVYYGTQSGTYTNIVTVGMATTVTVSNLISGMTYYFAATAFDVTGLESDYSSEVSTKLP